jgi:hypothetical protein
MSNDKIFIERRPDNQYAVPSVPVRSFLRNGRQSSERRKSAPTAGRMWSAFGIRQSAGPTAGGRHNRRRSLQTK